MKTRTKTNQALEWASILFFLIISPFIGCAAGGLIASYSSSSAAVRWESLGSPPEKSVKIVFAHLDSVYVQSATGKTYSCQIAPNRSCWIETQTDTSAFSSWTCHNETPVPPPSDKVISQADACNYAGPARRVVYVLSADGQIWMWRHAPETLIAGTEGVIPGAVVGLLIGIILVIIIGLTR